jgi:hypothetical protein
LDHGYDKARTDAAVIVAEPTDKRGHRHGRGHIEPGIDNGRVHLREPLEEVADGAEDGDYGLDYRGSSTSRPPSTASSTVAFLLSDLADLAVYTPLQRRRLMLAVQASGVVGLIVDSIVFLWLAFGTWSSSRDRSRGRVGWFWRRFR